MLKQNRICVIALTLFAVSVLAQASVLYDHGGTDVMVEDFVGVSLNESANTSICVVDFGVDSYAFAYRWNGSATAAEMMLALAGETDLYMESTDWGGALGLGVDLLAYDGNSAVSDWWNTWLGYWGSSDGVTWTPQNLGVSGTPLINGDWHGWSVEDDVVTYVATYPPVTPVPEPAASSLLVLGGLGLYRRRRRKN